MKNNIALIIFLFVCTIMLTGCADTVTFEQAECMMPVGFWYGLWHGLILTFAWIGSLINPDIAIYAIYNNGGWYDFGFLLGTGSLGFGVGFLKNLGN